MQRRPRKKPTINAMGNQQSRTRDSRTLRARQHPRPHPSTLIAPPTTLAESPNQHKNQSNETGNAPGRKLTAAVLLFLSGNRASRPHLLLGRHGRRRRRPRRANPQPPCASLRILLSPTADLEFPRARRAQGMVEEKEAGGGGSFVGGVGFRGIFLLAKRLQRSGFY